jgi:hypothetical protein
MKWLTKVLKKYIFLIVLVVVFVAADAVIAHYVPSYIIGSGRFWLNDFELTQRDNPEEVWDKVFFGNSAVYAAYRQEESESGFVDLGMDDAVLTDLWDMLRKGDVKIGSDLVLGLNWLTLYDDFETNPNYIWHRGALEPYCYFQRDRLREMLVDEVKLLALRSSVAADYASQTKTRYSSCLSDEALADKAVDFAQRYWSASPDAFENNYAALEKIIEYCNKNDIRVRVVWMPWNPKVEMPDLVRDVMESVNSICNDYGVEVHDMTDSLDAECFADIAHLNYEYGSHRFTKEVEGWLCS